MAMPCLTNSDATFGPQIDSACRSFDFTLYFEDIFFESVPAAIFLLLLLPAIIITLRRPSIIRRRSKLLAAKIISLLSLFACQTIFLAFRIHINALQSKASLAADVLFLLALCGAVALSYCDHVGSMRPSTLLIIYFSITTLFNIARLRTLWMIAFAESGAIVLSIISGLTVVTLILESTGKRTSIVSLQSDATPEQFSGFWKRTSFVWLLPTFCQGYSKILSVPDLPNLDPGLKSDVLARKLENTWAKYDKRKKYSLLRACFHAFASPFFAGVIPRLFLTGFTFAQPFLINTLISYVGESNADPNIGKGLIGAYALVYIGMAVSTALYWYQTFRFVIRIRGSLISLIYRQTVRARAVDLGEITAITLMGTDTERIVSGFRSIHEIWGSLLDISIAIWLLEREVFVACLVPAVISAVFIWATFKLSARANTYQRMWIEKIEKRLQVTSSMLGDMKAVKMLGLAEKMESIVQGLRQTEIETSRIFRKLLIWEVFFSNSPADLAPMATFGIFVIIAVVRHDNSLLTAQAFTTLSLISLLTAPVLTFIQAVPAIIQCLGCFERIQKYCSVPTALTSISKSNIHVSNDPSRNDSSISLRTLPKDGPHPFLAPVKSVVSFRNCNFGWKTDSNPVLIDLNMEIEMNEITMVVGAVGSGKSTLLESILGETAELGGQILRSFGSIAYCSQTPWLTNNTIRQNIVGAAGIDEQFYASVLWASGLEADLAQLTNGDQMKVGSNGANLSGGQKQRIALARAVYTRPTFILLDDIFSGMDAHTIDIVARRLFGDQGFFQKNLTTVILTTHTDALLAFADSIIVLDSGKVVEAGTLDSLRSRHGYLSNFSSKMLAEGSDAHVDSMPSQIDLHTVIEAAPDETLHDPKRQSGDFSVYRYYADVSGHKAVLLFLVFMGFWAFCGEFPTVWLKLWSDANTQSPNKDLGLYLGIYVFLGIAGVLCMTGACWFLLIQIISSSALQLHKDLLHSTLRAPYQFFNKTDIGSLTNRFSQDMELVDMDLPLLAINYVSALCSCVIKLVILAVFAKYLAITIPFVVAAIFILQKFYLRTSRQVRLLDLEAKAPLYSHFLESVSGAATVRAFGWQKQSELTCQNLLNNSQRPIYLLYCIQQWLGLVLDLIVAALAIILVSIVTQWRASFSAGAVGVSLVMVMTFNTTLMSLIKYWTLLETSVGAVSRVKTFLATTESEAKSNDTQPLPENWPTTGAVVFSNLSATHSSNNNPVLKGVSMAIKPGEKIAICGRSGSGKTSLILCVLKMLDLQEGSIFIDGVNISSLSYVDVRSNVNVVPQDPFLMPGTIRFNIDPFQTVCDEEIVRALKMVHLWEVIVNGGGLDGNLELANWSIGQRQLLCLARAIVRKSKLLILDEATSSVDKDTEAIMQNIIDSEFAGCTVLAVMHRLKYIKHYHRVALLDAGAIVEFDDPAKLLEQDSAFSKLYSTSGH